MVGFEESRRSDRSKTVGFEGPGVEVEVSKGRMRRDGEYKSWG